MPVNLKKNSEKTNGWDDFLALLEELGPAEDLWSDLPKDFPPERDLLDVNMFSYANKAIENLKYNYSLFELIDETYIFTLEFYNSYYSNLNKENILEIFDIYITIKQIQTQDRIIKEEYFEKMGIILYAIIQKELLKGREINSILKEKSITDEYYEYLHNYYEDFKLDLENDYEKLAKEVEEETNYSYSAYLFNYFETTLLLDYLELNSNKFDNTKNKSELDKVLAKISKFEY